MADTSTHLALPYMAPAQAQKHVTHNEALQILDAVVQLSVESRTLTSPPANPATGARFIVASPATGDWSGYEDQVAIWVANGWIFLSPQSGWRTWVEAEDAELVWSKSQWQPSGGSGIPMQNLNGVGINTSFDGTNRLAVSSDATLLSHDGADHQLKINKSTLTDTASLLFQTGYSGRAEMGLAGDDGFSIKVSADGSSWTAAFALDPSTGLASGDAVQTSLDDATVGRMMTTGAFGVGGEGLSIDPTGLDALDDGGIYQLSSPIAGVLDAGASLIHMQSDSNTAAQVGVDGATNAMHFRCKETGSWMDWQQLYSHETVLGLVSQSGGIPTGAIIERGSNPDGSYVRFADGTQICIRTATLGLLTSSSISNGLHRSDSVSFAHAVNFVPGSTVYASGGGGDLFPNGLFHGFAANSTDIFVRVAGLQSFINENAGEVRVISIGRWF